MDKEPFSPQASSEEAQDTRASTPPGKDAAPNTVVPNTQSVKGSNVPGADQPSGATPTKAGVSSPGTVQKNKEFPPLPPLAVDPGIQPYDPELESTGEDRLRVMLATLGLLVVATLIAACGEYFIRHVLLGAVK